MKHRCLSIFIALFCHVSVSGQDSLQFEGNLWKLYKIPAKAGMSISMDRLKTYKNVNLNADTVLSFLNDASLWPKDKYAMWMGAFIVSMGYDNDHTRKIIVSSYGGFLYDDLTKRYYEVAEEKRKEWYDFLNASAAKLDAHE
jgi:hypothetical protein